MIKIIKDNDKICAKVIRASYQTDNEFFTDSSDEIQLGIVTYPKNHKTGAHYHNHLDKNVNQTDEILLVKNGKARVDFYNDKGVYIKVAKYFKVILL